MKKIVMIVALMIIGVTAFAGPGQGIRTGDFIWSPSLTVKGVENSDVQVPIGDDEADASIVGIVRIGFRNEKSDKIRLKGNVWGRMERYHKLLEEDHDDFGEAISLSLWTRELLLVTIDEGYWKIEELDYGTGNIEEREDIKVGISLGRDLTDKMEADLAVRFDSREYESARLYDWNEYSAVGEVAYAVTEKTAAILTGKAGIQSSDANASDGELVAVHVGFKTRQTEKITAKVGVGYLTHSSDNDISGVSFDAAASWQATEKVSFHIDGANTVEPATQNLNNNRTVTKASIGWDWEMIDAVTLSASGIFRRNDYDRKVTVAGAPMDKEDTMLEGVLRMTFAPPPNYFEFFAEGRHVDRDSTIGENDYDFMMWTVGATVRY